MRGQIGPAPLGLGTGVGARVASPRCPILPAGSGILPRRSAPRTKSELDRHALTRQIPWY